MSDYEVHPVAALFPMMSGSAFESLKSDIREHGQREAITTWKGMIVDGRNRLRACEELGIEPTVGEMDEDTDPVPWIISLNLHRRHLTESQRAMIASSLATMGRGKPPKDNPLINGLTMSTNEAAAALQVSESSVEKARFTNRNCSPEVVELVNSGAISINAARNFAKAVPDKGQQSEIAAQGAVAVKAKAKQAPKNKPREQPKEPEPQPEKTAGQKKADNKAEVTAAVAALKQCQNPCVAIEKWLRSATQEQVSIIWSVADELLDK